MALPNRQPVGTKFWHCQIPHQVGLTKSASPSRPYQIAPPHRSTKSAHQIGLTKSALPNRSTTSLHQIAPPNRPTRSASPSRPYQIAPPHRSTKSLHQIGPPDRPHQVGPTKSLHQIGPPNRLHTIGSPDRPHTIGSIQSAHQIGPIQSAHQTHTIFDMGDTISSTSEGSLKAIPGRHRSQVILSPAQILALPNAR